MTGRSIALTIFGALVAAGLVLAYRYGRRSRDADSYWAAGGAISARRNALATVGDFLSGSSLLGGVGLLFLGGVDGTFYLVLPLVAWIPVILLVAERLRNLGRFTLTDVLARRFDSRPVRLALAASTLVITGVYLLAQLVVMGNLFTLLSGLDYTPAVVLSGIVMIFYVAVGGMGATTVIQAVKAVLLIGVLLLMSVLLVVRFDGDLGRLFSAAAKPSHGMDPLQPGALLHGTWNTLSVGLALTLGVAGMPHVMMRFFTVPDAVQARRSVAITAWLIAGASVLVGFIGLGTAALLRSETATLAATGGNLVTPRLAEVLGGGTGSLGGAVVLGIVSAVAFATVVAVVSGLLLNAASTVVRDVWHQLPSARAGVSPEREARRGRIACTAVGAVVILLAVGLGPDFNATRLVTLAFGVAASANFPVLLLSLGWRRLTHAGAIAGILTGLISSVVLMLLGPLWPGTHPPVGLEGPTIIALPLALLGCWAGSLLSRRDTTGEQADGEFRILQAEAELGIRAAAQSPSH